MAGSEEVPYQMDHYRSSRNRIFGSHDKSFVDGVLREVKDSGVDFILKSLWEDLLHVTRSCVA